MILVKFCFLFIIQEENFNWPEPQCLVENENGGMNMKLNESTANALSDIRVPLVVVSIVGMYRTGKSYLMNRLAGVDTGKCMYLGLLIRSFRQYIFLEYHNARN